MNNHFLSIGICAFAVASPFVAPPSLAGLVVGNGKVVTEQRPGGFVNAIASFRMDQYWVGDCNMFRFEGGAGKIAKLVITGESNLLPHLKTSISGNKLEMSLREYIKPTQPIVVAAIGTGQGRIGGFACMSGSTFSFPVTEPKQK